MPTSRKKSWLSGRGIRPAWLESEKELEEALKSIRVDQENINRVLAETTGRPLDQISQDVSRHITLNALQAKEYGLAHEIRQELFPGGAEVAVVRETERSRRMQVMFSEGDNGVPY